MNHEVENVEAQEFLCEEHRVEERSATFKKELGPTDLEPGDAH